MHLKIYSRDSFACASHHFAIAPLAESGIEITRARVIRRRRGYSILSRPQNRASRGVTKRRGRSGLILATSFSSQADPGGSLSLIFIAIDEFRVGNGTIVRPPLSSFNQYILIFMFVRWNNIFQFSKFTTESKYFRIFLTDIILSRTMCPFISNIYHTLYIYRFLFS